MFGRNWLSSSFLFVQNHRIAQYGNKNMNSEQDTPGSWQALMVAFKIKKITELHKTYQKYKI